MIILCGMWLLLDNTHPNALSLQKIAAENIINSIENKWYTSTRSWINVYGIYSVQSTQGNVTEVMKYERVQTCLLSSLTF